MDQSHGTLLTFLVWQQHTGNCGQGIRWAFVEEVAELQADITALTTGWRQSALEVDASYVMEVVVSRVQVSVFQELIRLRWLQHLLAVRFGHLLNCTLLTAPCPSNLAFWKQFPWRRLRIHPAAELSGLGALKAWTLAHALARARDLLIL